jgi:hypothetical protein
MFEPPKFVQNGFSVIFPRQPSIRRLANSFEDKLKGLYVQPQIISVPDELDPEVPRMVFGSKHGYSQIIVSQISISLSIAYSPDWQLDISKGKQYLLDRVSTVFDLLALLDQVRPCFSGLTTRANLTSIATDKETIAQLSGTFLGQMPFENVDEVQIMIARTVDARFYSNVSVQNYRTWRLEGPKQGIVRMSRQKTVERGIQVLGDFNDRHAFNESEDYYTSLDAAKEIIERAVVDVNSTVTALRGK